MSEEKKRKITHRIGIVSDTHGLVRPGLIQALQGVERIIHAGDVGKPEVLHALQAVAPVVAVRGNMDRGHLVRNLRSTEVVEAGDFLFYVLHDLYELDLDPGEAGFRAVIFGHSHRPSVKEKDGVLYLNPGSAGPRRFKLPVTLVRLTIRGKRIEPRVIKLEA